MLREGITDFMERNREDEEEAGVNGFGSFLSNTFCFKCCKIALYFKSPVVESTAVGKPLRARAAGVAARGKDGEDIPCSSPPVVSVGLSVDCIRIVYTTLFSCCLPFINGSLL